MKMSLLCRLIYMSSQLLLIIKLLFKLLNLLSGFILSGYWHFPSCLFLLVFLLNLFPYYLLLSSVKVLSQFDLPAH